MDVVAARHKYLADGKLSDATLVLTGREQPAESSKATIRISVHRVILAAACEYFESKLCRWAEHPTGSSNIEIVEVCELEEVEAASGVVEIIYHGKVLGNPAAMQVVQMLKVAGRWLTVGCMQHCLNYLAALPDAELTAATLVAVLKELPHGLDQLCNVAGWYQRCTTIAMSVPENAPERLPLAVQVISLLSRTSLPYLPLMMSVFGNVSKVLEEPELLHAFQLVPFTAVAAWAASDQLMVDSENSVAVALDVWCRGPQGSQCTGEQLRELAGLVRVCQCSQVYLLNALPLLGYFRPVREELKVATVPIMHGLSLPEAGHMLTQQGVDLPAAWYLKQARQPVSHPSSFEIMWEVPKEQIAAALKSTAQTVLYSPPQYRQGTGMQLQLTVHECAQPGLPRSVGVFVRACDYVADNFVVAEKLSVVVCSFEISCAGRDAYASESHVVLTAGWGWHTFFQGVTDLASLRPHMSGDNLVLKARVEFKQ